MTATMVAPELGRYDVVPALEIRELRTDFHMRNSNVRAVDGVSLSVMPGECVGLVGESGCGKSTIGLSAMRLLPGNGHIAGGSVLLGGRDLVPLSEGEMQRVRGNEMGMIFQDPMTSLNPTLTIGRQIGEPLRAHKGASKAEAEARAVELLRLVGMPKPEERLRQYPHQLSGGLRQRVMIAMALACDPKILIADEPTTALDVTIQAQILDLIDELRERLDMAVLLITHDMGVIAARTSRVVVMYAGKVAEAAGTDELFGRMRHPYSEALFESIPRLDQDPNELLYSIPGLPPDLSKPVTACRFAPRCRYATEECVTVEPPLEGGEHVFACYHPVNGTPENREAEQRSASLVSVRPRTPAATGGDGKRAGTVTGAAGSGNTADVAPLLALSEIDKQYEVTGGAVMKRPIGTIKAVSGVSISVSQGQTFGLVGESGCGKTTLGRLVTALEKPTGGSVVFQGDDLSRMRGSELRARRRQLQLMFQDPYSSLDPRMRVRGIVGEPLRVQKQGSRRDQDRRVGEVLNEVGLASRAAELYPHEFSGGQRQRIGLARALVLQPKLIVADEPVSALDVSVQAQILNLMKSLQSRHGLTYIVISHDLAVVKYLADTIGVMYLGKLVEIGPAEKVYTSPAHPYTQALIDTIPVPDPALSRAKRGAAMKGELPSAMNPPSGCRFRTRCPFAQERCAVEEPQLRLFGPGHRAACHFALQPAVSEATTMVGE